MLLISFNWFRKRITPIDFVKTNILVYHRDSAKLSLRLHLKYQTNQSDVNINMLIMFHFTNDVSLFPMTAQTSFYQFDYAASKRGK